MSTFLITYNKILLNLYSNQSEVL